MSNHVLLNNIDHKDLRVITERSAEYGDNVMFAMTFPDEMRSVQAHYPIFFHKDGNTGEFYPVAMFGLKGQENLFLGEKGWDAAYIPLVIARQPFLIGIQQFQEDGVMKQQRVLHIDMDSPRLSYTAGEPLFLEYGGNSPYLEQVAGALEAIHQGYQSNKPFVEKLLALDLLESFTLEIELNDGSKNQLMGFYTINETRLSELNGEALADLNAQGWLQPIFMAVASQSHIRDLIERKNRELPADARA
ncbi:SapC family protein [Proteobacteria bacterium 005FR1]|nr:SapC family protein [Proteobacteria bacterium 005FR1]